MSNWDFNILETILAPQGSSESLCCEFVFVIQESRIDKLEAVICDFDVESSYTVESNTKELSVEVFGLFVFRFVAI